MRAQVSVLESERELLRQKVSHLEESATAQGKYVSTLQAQMTQMQSQVVKLQEERASLQDNKDREILRAEQD